MSTSQPAISSEQVIQRVVLFQLDFRIWAGRKKLKESDFKSTDGLPPADLASLGTKRICNPDALKPFHKFRKRAETALLRHGSRFMGGYAIPDEFAKIAASELEMIVEEATQYRQQFLSGYDQEVESWISAHPDWDAQIRSSIDSVNHVASRLVFDFIPVRINPAAEMSSGGLNRATNSLLDQMLSEVAKSASTYWETSISGKPFVTQHALRPLRSMREKLAAWTFIDPRIEHIKSSIDTLLARMPASGPINGDLLDAISNLALILSDSERMLNHGQRLMAGESAEPILFARRPIKATVEVEPVTCLSSDLFGDAMSISQQPTLSVGLETVTPHHSDMALEDLSTPATVLGSKPKGICLF